MTSGTENQIVSAIESAEEIRDPLIAETLGQKPRLLIEDCNPDRTVAALRDTLFAAGGLYDRGVPVRLAFGQIQRGTVAQVMTPDALVLIAHAVCRPYVLKAKPDGTVSEVNARLPRSFAVMYLDWRGEWRLAPLNGIASAPLLQDDGTVNSDEGHDPVSGMWCENLPNLAGLVSERPTKNDAAAAFRLIRETFKTFCFADAETMDDAADGVATVDTSKAPGRDESSFLVALLTAVCRPSVTAGATAEELEKRIAAELIEGSPALFLYNLNNTAFKSNLLASAITEREYCVVNAFCLTLARRTNRADARKVNFSCTGVFGTGMMIWPAATLRPDWRRDHA
jgi:hypothetical protein